MDTIFNAIRELYLTPADALAEADLSARLREWWWVVTHPHLLDGPPPQRCTEPVEVKEAGQ